MKIGIVADTSSNFTPELAEKLGIHLVPMQIVMDGETYKDAIDLSIEEFYKKMEISKALPTTSQPAIGEFIKLYEEIEDDYDKIISIHPSSKLSGTLETAMIAANQVNPEKITVFDSALVSILTGYLVLEAKRLVNLGKSYNVIMNRLMEMKERTVAFVMIENFDNLVRSGRLPRIAGKITKLAQIKPILKISSKGIELEKIVRTSKRAFKKVDEIAHDYLEKLDYPARIDVAHGNLKKVAEEKFVNLASRYPDRQSEIYRLAAVIGVHTGTGIVGYTLTPEYND